MFLVANCHGKEFQCECLSWQGGRGPGGQCLAQLRKGPSSRLQTAEMLSRHWQWEVLMTKSLLCGMARPRQLFQQGRQSPWPVWRGAKIWKPALMMGRNTDVIEGRSAVKLRSQEQFWAEKWKYWVFPFCSRTKRRKKGSDSWTGHYIFFFPFLMFCFHWSVFLERNPFFLPFLFHFIKG